MASGPLVELDIVLDGCPTLLYHGRVAMERTAT